MGLAASQGRLLLLTARKSDLEFRAQQISQRRLCLASQLETISTDYSKAIGNRVLKFTYDVVQGQTNYTATETLSYQGLVGTKRQDGQYYRVTDALGRVIVPTVPTVEDCLPSGYMIDKESGNLLKIKLDENGKPILDADNNKTYEQVVDKEGNAVPSTSVLPKINKDGTFEFTDPATGLTETYIVAPSIVSPSVFQQGLRNGAYFIQNYNPNGESDKPWQTQMWQSMEEIQDILDTDDDAYAQSIYETKTAMVQSQDKKFELELKQVETQHSAIQTEVESVQKVIDKNIQSSFKMFQNG